MGFSSFGFNEASEELLVGIEMAAISSSTSPPSPPASPYSLSHLPSFILPQLDAKRLLTKEMDLTNLC